MSQVWADSKVMKYRELADERFKGVSSNQQICMFIISSSKT